MANPVQIMLASGILLSLGWAAYEASRDLPSLPAADAEQPRAVELDLALPELVKLPLANYSATLERPLFAASRSPETSSAPKVVAPIQNTSTPNIRVTAIIIRNEERSAMLESGNPPKQSLVRKGGSVAGWEVTRIGEQSVTVASGGREHRIELRQFDAPLARKRKAPQPKRPPVRRAPRLVPPIALPVPATGQPNDID